MPYFTAQIDTNTGQWTQIADHRQILLFITVTWDHGYGIDSLRGVPGNIHSFAFHVDFIAHRGMTIGWVTGVISENRVGPSHYSCFSKGKETHWTLPIMLSPAQRQLEQTNAICGLVEGTHTTLP